MILENKTSCMQSDRSRGTVVDGPNVPRSAPIKQTILEISLFLSCKNNFIPNNNIQLLRTNLNIDKSLPDDIIKLMSFWKLISQSFPPLMGVAHVVQKCETRWVLICISKPLMSFSNYFDFVQTSSLALFLNCLSLPDLHYFQDQGLAVLLDHCGGVWLWESKQIESSFSHVQPKIKNSKCNRCKYWKSGF